MSQKKHADKSKTLKWFNLDSHHSTPTQLKINVFSSTQDIYVNKKFIQMVHTNISNFVSSNNLIKHLT